jgi:hypothetical protein
MPRSWRPVKSEHRRSVWIAILYVPQPAPVGQDDHAFTANHRGSYATCFRHPPIPRIRSTPRPFPAGDSLSAHKGEMKFAELLPGHLIGGRTRGRTFRPPTSTRGAHRSDGTGSSGFASIPWTAREISWTASGPAPRLQRKGPRTTTSRSAAPGLPWRSLRSTSLRRPKSSTQQSHSEQNPARRHVSQTRLQSGVSEVHSWNACEKVIGVHR